MEKKKLILLQCEGATLVIYKRLAKFNDRMGKKKGQINENMNETNKIKT